MARPSQKEHFLRVIRESNDLSPQRMSKECGVSKFNIWRAEVGKSVSDEAVSKIAERLGISPDIIYYNMGKIPPDKNEYFTNDPLFFKELIDEACEQPWRLTKTKDYMEELKNTQIEVRNRQNMSAHPEVKKILSRIKPTE